MILLWLLRCHWGRWEDLMVTGSLAIQPYWKEPGVGWEPHQGHLDLKKQAETFHSLGTCEESSWHFHRTSCFCARFSNFKVCFGGTYWNALSFSEAPQNGTESENCGSISTVSLKITGKNIGLRRSREGLWRSVTQGSGTRRWPSLLAHPKLQKVDQSGPGCLRSSSKHMIRNNCRTALGKLPTSYVLCRCLSIF